MLSPADLIPLPYTSDLTPAAAAYASQTLPYAANLKSPGIYKHLHQVVAQQAAQLAFRRHLTVQQVPHNIRFDSQFARPNPMNAVIGGRTCRFSCTLITTRQEIRRIHHDLACLLSYPASLPSSELSQEIHLDADLLVFSFVTGLVTPTHSDIRKAVSAGEPVSMLFPLATAWSQPSRWGPLGSMVLKSECDRKLILKLVGRAGDNSLLVEEVELLPRVRVQTLENFYSLEGLQTADLPSHRLGLHCPILNQTLVIQAHQWRNIWVYGMDIFLAGWMTRGEFRRKVRSHQSLQTLSSSQDGQGNHLSVPVTSLHPLSDLFTRAFSWRSTSNTG